MPTASLLLREDSSPSLSTLVGKSQQKQPPHPQYDLQLTQNHLELIEKIDHNNQPIHVDEGFESDVDTVSIVSSDFETKTTETDSANGSASSDSDTETIVQATKSPEQNKNKESHNLVDCVCYSDVKVPDVLVFVIKQEALVFKFDNLKELRAFYLNFTALKAVTNQKAYSKNSGSAKFNLLQRTDRNGVTHIEITREPDRSSYNNDGRTNIISLNTPENGKFNNRQRSDAILIQDRFNTIGTRHSSNENILNLVNLDRSNLKKVWNSAEDLLGPKRPERRKKTKAPPPPPPPSIKNDVMRGEYVRVNVNHLQDNKNFIVKSQVVKTKPPPPITSSRPLVTLLKPRGGGGDHPPQDKRNATWTNSVPRLLLKQRSRSETRNFTPMAYRYIDTTPTYNNNAMMMTSHMGNRFFGLSPKLRDFPPIKQSDSSKWCNLEEKKSDSCGNLKSVIKKDENKKKNDKKVTFSAYTTVQVV